MQTTLYAYPASLTKDKSGRFLVRFPDLPEALTDGVTEEEALAEASDCLSEALMSRIADGESIPHPSPVGRNQYQIAPDSTVSIKAALYMAMRETGTTAATLARRLGIDHKEVRRMLDPRHPSKHPRLIDALQALGLVATFAVFDASRRVRIMSAPGAVKRSTMRPRTAIAVARE